ncbi:MAG: hypothetical protein COX02_02350 [Candidatus Vogelbacteria bacterium CG22_combo_CG10-13_8_21_14_all_37_9]|uniref:PrgI family protein n=1 Tax=Candidatus Vogelbacteria bacterium CG22_combo_CG10-13_8_21_14_all_37_9 TaxID=1975046 RepID=A0A2H0BK73_9BACT|nr:MAG: hypothetical protein BK005_01315 [bacterium CG10_37_50]PIP58075.1 MAG: hypothetical protein COX02_02350 [Candidatus Vogelbacteria bacterium CG22_combo_CG10-13_8_21_14_all_37_9]
MNFQVPQFIEVEDKIIGPLTFKQFIYLAGGAGLAFLIYSQLGLYLGAVPIIVVGAFSFALAFYKINNRPFIYTLQSALKYYLSSKLYLWKKNYHPAVGKKIVLGEDKGIQIPRLSDSRLKELSWSLNVKEHLDQPEN